MRPWFDSVWNAPIHQTVLEWHVATWTHLHVYSVELSVLVAHLGTHIYGHVAQIAHHARHLHNVFVHFVFASVVGDSGEWLRVHRWMNVQCGRVTWLCNRPGLLVHSGRRRWFSAGRSPRRRRRLFSTHSHTQDSFQSSPFWNALCFNTPYVCNPVHLFQGRTQRPQHFSMPFKCSSASFMSLLMLSKFCSVRSICSKRKNLRTTTFYIFSISTPLSFYCQVFNWLINLSTANLPPWSSSMTSVLIPASLL